MLFCLVYLAIDCGVVYLVALCSILCDVVQYVRDVACCRAQEYLVSSVITYVMRWNGSRANARLKISQNGWK